MILKISLNERQKKFFLLLKYFFYFLNVYSNSLHCFLLNKGFMFLKGRDCFSKTLVNIHCSRYPSFKVSSFELDANTRGILMNALNFSFAKAGATQGSLMY